VIGAYDNRGLDKTIPPAKEEQIYTTANPE
jgi:hypothetical protein